MIRREQGDLEGSPLRWRWGIDTQRAGPGVESYRSDGVGRDT